MENIKGNFSFKKVIHEGRFRSFKAEEHIIKLGGRKVGYINQSRCSSVHPNGDNKFHISFAVKKEKTAECPSGFKWIHLKATFDNAEEARAMIKKNQAGIIAKFDLHLFEKE